jgi:alpha-tubulin suppressor-like RCC1 family protein
MSSRRMRAVSLTAASVLVLGMLGGWAAPAHASSPVYSSDTLRSGAGLGWGKNDHGQAATGAANPSLGPKQLPNGASGLLGDAVSIAAGAGYTVWVAHNGMVWAMGDNSLGTLGNHVTGGDQRTPVRTWGFGSGTDPKATKVSAYGTEGVALDVNGNVWHWGRYLCSATSYVTSPDPTKLVFPSGTGRIVDIATGSGFALALAEDGRVYAWGVNTKGQLGQGTTTGSAVPVRIASILASTSGQLPMIDAGRDFGMYTLSTPAGVTLQTWGSNASYQLGYPSSTADQKTPRTVLTLAAPAKVLQISGGGTHGLLLTNDGGLRSWGSNGLTTSTSPTVVPDPLGALTGAHHPYTVAAGDGASFAASTDGTVAAWGVDTNGQLGRTTTGNLASPTLVPVPFTSGTGAGVPALITSRNNATFAVADGQTLRSPEMAGYDFGRFSTAPASGQVAPSHTFTLTNLATKPVTISSAVLDGSHPGDFQLGASTCTGTLAVDATCTIAVTFTPTAAGARTASINIRESNTLGGVVMQTFVRMTGNGFTPVVGIANTALNRLSPGTQSGPGNSIALTGIPPYLIPGTQAATSAAPLGKTPLGKTPLGKTPLGKTPLGKTPLGKTPLGKTPLGKTPLGKTPLGKTPLGKTPLGKTPLSEFTLLRQGGWVEFLSSYANLRNVPVSALTFADLTDPLKNQPAAGVGLPLERLTLGDLAISATPLAQFSLLDFLMGGTTLAQYSGIDWCADLAALKSYGSCTDGTGLNRTLFDLEVAGLSLDLTRAPSTTVGQLRSDALDSSVFADVLLSSVTLTGTHPGQILLTAIPSLTGVLDCTKTSCTNLAGRTLGDTDVVAALQPTAAFRDLGTALNPITLGQLVEPFLDRSSFDWESLPLSLIPASAYPNRAVYALDADLNCTQAAGTVAHLVVPAGFVPVPGTTVLTNTRGTGTTLLADPTPTSTGVDIRVPDSAYSGTGAIACTDDSAHLTITTSFLPPAKAGTYVVAGNLTTTALTGSTASAAPVTITGLNQPPDDTPDGPPGFADQLIIGSITTAGQVAYVPFDAPAGKVIEATIASQTADFDGILYYPKGALADPALSAATPAVRTAFGEAATVEPDALHSAQTTFGGALQDIPLLTDRPIAAISATRGTDVEQLSAVARAGNDVRHVLAVHGYIGQKGTFTVRLRLTDAPGLADCTATPVTAGSPPAQAFYGSSGYVAGDNTLVLVNASRLAGRFGSTDTTAALNALRSYVTSGASGVHGQVLQVDSDPTVRAAYAAWDASPCDPLKADGVVRAVNAFVYANAPSTITDLVIAGGDEVLPHARLEDHTRDGNEREQAGDLAVLGGNPLAAALAGGYYLSDDPYGTRTPQTVLGQLLYLPQAITSRLGESAASIAKQANDFVTNNGVADPSTARTAVATDYDFLTNGGNETAAALSGAGYTTDHTLTGQSATWDESKLEAAWIGKTTVPSVAALNMHYDQYRGLPAAGSALYTSQAVAAGPSLDRRLVFTIGCHSALDVPDSYAPGDARTADFAQTYLAKGVAGMVGNLGFGYADTSTVAYSAQLQSYFAQGLKAGYDLGTALSEAKRLYVQRLAGLSAYDLKSAQQMILWGLPQYRLSGAAAVPAPTATVTTGTTEPITGLTSQTLDVGTAAQPLKLTSVNDGTTTHLTAEPTDTTVADKAPHTAAVPGKPVLPVQYVDVPQVAGKTVRSVLPLSLTSDPLTPVTATFARPAVDHGQAPEPQSNGVFPAALGHVGSAFGALGNTNTLVVTPAEFFADGTAPGKGSLRTFRQSQWLALYGAAGDVVQPTITGVSGTRIPASGGNPATTSYAIDVQAAASPIARVYVLALPRSGSGTWVRTELTNTAGNRWTGGAADLLGEFVVVAVARDGAGGLSTQKGLGWSPDDLIAPISPAFPVQLQINPGTPSSGWFTSNPSITIAGNGGSTSGYLLSIDGGSPVPSGTQVTGDGVHTVRLVAPDGSLVPGGLPVLIDTQQPRVLISSDVPVGGRIELHQDAPFAATVFYGASGPKAQSDNGVNGPAGREFDASATGARTLVVTATSVAGLTGSASQAYRVVYGAASSGFLAPVASIPGLNLTVRTLVYSFDFHLVDHDNVAVTSGNETGNTVTYTPETCPNSQYKVQLPKLASAGAQPVHTGSGTWSWDLAMPNPGNVLTCYRMVVTANDGYTHFDADVQVAP